MEDLDALLADLHNTTVNLNQGGSPVVSPSGGYGSVSSAKQQAQNSSGDEMAAAPSTYTTRTTERYEYRQAMDPALQPIYQNQHVIREIKTTTSDGHMHGGGGGGGGISLTSNLSELDNLLEDLNAARFQHGYKDKKSPSTNGPPVSYSSREIEGPPRSPALGHPTIESLLDELQSAVPPRIASPSHRMYATTTATEVKSAAPQTAASSATKELDDLMASLSDFKLNTTPAQHSRESDPAYAKPQKAKSNRGNQLESMLGTLQSDMSKQGVNTAAKGHCTACNKPIVGQVVTALGKTWHPEHFTCAHCNQELGTKNFFERDGEPYCETDYHNIFSPRCAYCNGPILDKCVTALDKTWHPEHFFCAQCGRQFGEDGFHEKDGKPFCREDYFDMFAPKCGGCNRPITENYISALNSQWHPECFVCRDCRQSFSGGSFYDHDGQPYCETHYHAKRGSLCAGCHKPITGRCITAMFRKFHPEHFVCSFCLKQLNKGTFKEQNDKPYCHACFDKLFG